MIKQAVSDKIDDETKEISDFVYKHFKCVSFNNILSFVEEIKAFPNWTLGYLFNDMNLTKK